MPTRTKPQISFKDGFNNRALKAEIDRIRGVREVFTAIAATPYSFACGITVPCDDKFDILQSTAEFFLGKEFSGLRYSGGPIEYDFDLTGVQRVYAQTVKASKYIRYSEEEILSLAWSYTRYAPKNADTVLFDKLCSSFFDKDYFLPGERMQFVTETFKWLEEFGFDFVSTEDENMRTMAMTLTPKPEALRPQRN